jgi:L-alanine-DL-glutamate epimerase-like enolase superfamily enzyme
VAVPDEGRIASVTATVLRGRDGDRDLDGSSETLLVTVADGAGHAGIGEVDGPPAACRSLITRADAHPWSRGFAGLLIERDPFERSRLWSDLAAATRYDGEGGISRYALAGIDIAVHDLAARQLGRPVHSLLGGACRDRIHCYATVYDGAPDDRDLGTLLDDLCAILTRAVAAGFTAVKFEALFDGLADDRSLVGCIRQARETVGDDVRLLVDFGYRWTDWRDARAVLRRLESLDIWLAEATLRHTDLEGHARLAASSPTRIGGAEHASSLEECRAWLEIGHVDVLQPDIARCGGFTEMLRVAALADLHGASVIPHCWKTGIDAAAARHFHAAVPNCPMIEMLAPELYASPLRRQLTLPEPEVTDGTMALPTAPGLGVNLVTGAVARYEVTE